MTPPTGRPLARPAAGPASSGDALGLAAAWCAGAARLPGRPATLAFGTPSTAWVLVGERRTLALSRTNAGGATLWAPVQEFLGGRGFVAGWLGFDAAWPDGLERDPGAGPAIRLAEPDAVLRIDAADGKAPRCTAVQDSPLLATLAPAPVPAGEAVPLRPLDADPFAYRRAVARVLEAIRRGEAQRLTVARRVPLPPDLDLLASFAASPGQHADPGGIARSYYLCADGLELAGHSPELLGAGDARRFTCHKLSGTGPRAADPASDDQLRAALLADPKILEEHALSIEATRAALAALGAVSTGARKLFERRGLRHLLTPLTVDTAPGTTLAAILRVLLPAGAQPRDAALRLLSALEPASRGPYYGLIGLRQPGGEFEFSQVLRTLFRDATGVHTWVGAAVTGRSTAEGECEETRLKLADVTAVRPRSRAAGRAPRPARP